MFQEVSEEFTDFWPPNILPVQLEVEPEAAPARTDGECRNGGYSVVLVKIVNDRRLAARPPGAADRWNQLEAGFVGKCDMGAQPCGVFFTLGQRRRFHS